MTASIPIPKNFMLPDGIKEGDDFKQLVTFQIKGDKLVVKSVGDVEMPDEDDDDFATAVTKNIK